MPSQNLIFKYFPSFSTSQRTQIAALGPLYERWNARVNLVSRADLPNLYERHVLHSLAIARLYPFPPGSEIMDLGTGGGFPGIPLAIAFPQSRFTLVDSIGKKIKAVDAIAGALELKNVNTLHARAESIEKRFDYIVSRATSSIPDLESWTAGRWRTGGMISPLRGLICLKGGALDRELGNRAGRAIVSEISDFFEEEHFKQKKVVFLPPGRRGSSR